jgi:HEAT repeat protein/transcriptional regulator with XRE-family HTH domain
MIENTEPTSECRVPSGRIVRELRARRGWTRADLATRADCSEETIVRVECCQSTQYSTLSQIAEALGVEVRELLAGVEPVMVVVEVTTCKLFGEDNEWIRPDLERAIKSAISDGFELISTRKESQDTMSWRSIKIALTWEDSIRLLDACRARTLGECGVFWMSLDREVVPALIGILQELGSLDRIAAARALAELGPAARVAVPALIDLLHDGSREARMESAKALGAIGPDARAAVPALIERLRCGDCDAQFPAAALGRIGPEARAAMPALIDLLQRGDPDARSAAAAALGGIGPEARAAVPAVIEWLQRGDPDADIVATALGRIGPDARDAVPPLIDRLQRGDSDARRAAAAALGRIGPAAVPPLIDRLQRGDWDVRRAAAAALGGIGPEAREAVPALIELLQRGDSDTRGAAAAALGRIGGQEAVPALIELLQGGDWDAYSAAAKVLGEIGTEARAAVPALIERLRRGDRRARIAAAALGGIGPDARAAVPPLIELLQQPGDLNARIAAAVALDRIAGQVARGEVPDPEIVSNAMRALSDIGREAVPSLIGLLGAGDAGVRRTAARILALMDLSEIDIAALRLIKAGEIDIHGVSKKIPNIRLLRDRTGCGLMQAKGSVEKMMALGDDALQRLIEKLTDPGESVASEATRR